MDDHFWPSLYPGIIVGVILGLSGRTLVSTLLGACGGLIGAYFALLVVTYFAIEQGIFTVLTIVIGAAFFAKIFLFIALKMSKLSS